MTQKANYTALIQKLMDKGWLPSDLVLELAAGNDISRIRDEFTPSKGITRLVHLQTLAKVELGLDEHALSIYHLHAGTQLGNGVGTARMNEICEICDYLNFNIVLEACDQHRSPKYILKLVDFYSKFGFELNQDEFGYEVNGIDDLSDSDICDGVPLLRIAIDARPIKLQYHNQLVGYNGDDYATYAEAQRDKADFHTPSTLDALTIEAGSSNSGLFDMIEVADMVMQVNGAVENLVFGILDTNNRFVTLHEARELLSE
ncbi:hypothetical protein A6E01_19025 (plasmid) [Vibrio breoganii]|uniref:Uncharacterized protein n=1 Tax=Vibrio breoganii TaxID=553239 RepID=A0AAN0XYX6_9VIBR|nr:hypothetical protein [Vibrio breoganii]ANO35307.1 hypothetical protein A6E01_19025 [Vibrio breoganii]